MSIETPNNQQSCSSDDAPEQPANYDHKAHLERRHASFRKELEALINYNSMENGSDTPDFLLAEYLHGCLINFDVAVLKRDVWYGRKKEPAITTPISPPKVCEPELSKGEEG